MTVGVAVPWAADGDRHRVAALDAVAARLHDAHPTWGFAVGASPAGAEWCKARAARRAVNALDGPGVLVVHDADVLADPRGLDEAVLRVAAGDAWALPHGEVRRLSRTSTELLLAGHPEPSPRLERHAYRGVPGGGVVVLSRDAWEECPLDPRFVGWGSEDESWGWALEALHGAPWRAPWPLLHLWHPHAAPGQRRSVRPASARLWRAYRAARRDPAAIRALVDGAR